MRPHSMILLLCALFTAVDSANPCDITLIRDVTAEEVNYNSTTKVLTCKDGPDSLMAIEINSKRYKSISCDEVDGWKDSTIYPQESNKYRGEFIANASEPISVKCVEYCTVENRTGVVSRTMNMNMNSSELIRTFTCDYDQKLFVNGVKVIGTPFCDFNGWIVPSEQSIDTPLQMECRRGCTQGDRTDVIMSLSSDKESKTVFKSSKPEEAGDKHGVSVNGKVYAYLECDSTDGFTDKDGNKISEDPFASVDLNHDIVPTTTTTVPTTTTTTGETTTPSGVAPPAPAPPGPSAPSKDESSTEDAEERTSPGVIGVSIAALILIVIVIVMISIVVKKKQPENKESNSKSDSSNSGDKKSKKKRMSSGKDDIPTEVKLEKPVKF